MRAGSTAGGAGTGPSAGLGGAAGEVLAALDALPLVDHHVHGAFAADPTPQELADALVEADTAPVDLARTDPFDSQLGTAVRRWCAPLLDLEPHAPAATYLARRAELGEDAVAARLLPAAGVGTWLVDTGHGAGRVQTPAQLAAASGSPAREVVRLEEVAEQVVAGGPHDWAQRFGEALAARTSAGGAVGLKSVIAYRSGFAVDWSTPPAGAVQRAADAWARDLEATGARPRLVDPVLLVAGVLAGLATGLPLQLHVGFGDRDLDLRAVDPLLLRPLLLRPDAARTPVLLLHCYPYERSAGYLAQAFTTVHLDVGLALGALGARSPSLVARSLELAPFSRVLYSSDAWGPPELHLLGALLWRRGTARVLGGFVEDGEWSLEDAVGVARRVGAGNAARVYRL